MRIPGVYLTIRSTIDNLPRIFVLVFGDPVIYALQRGFYFFWGVCGTLSDLGMTINTSTNVGAVMTAGPRRGPKLSQIRAQGTPLSVAGLPEAFVNWALANKLPTAESLYGYFYTRSVENDRVLESVGMNYHRLFDRLCKAIPAQKRAELDRLADHDYQLGEM